MATRSLLRSAGPLMAGRATSAALGFLLPAVLARLLDQASYGTYKQLFLVSNLALHSLQFGLAQSLFFFVPRADPAERRAWIAQAFMLLGFVGALVGTLLWLGGPLLADSFTNPQILEIALPLGILAGALIASSPVEVALTAQGRPHLSALALVGSDAMRIGLMLAAVLSGRGLTGLAWGAAVAAGIRLFIALSLALGPGAFAPSRTRVRSQLAYAIPFGLAILLAMPQQQFHQLFVASRVDPAAFAIYAVGCLQIPIVSLLYTPISDTMQVRMAALEREGRTHQAASVFSEAVDRLAVVFLPMCALLMAVARPLLVLVYGEKYADSAAILQIAVLSVAVASLPVDGVLKARARTRTLLWAYAAKLAVTWPLLALGFRLGGMQGAIGAHVGVETLTKGGLLAVVCRDLGQGLGGLLGGARLGRSISTAGLTGLAAWLASASVSSPFFACAAGGLAGSAVLGAELLLRRRRSPPPPPALDRAA